MSDKPISMGMRGIGGGGASTSTSSPFGVPGNQNAGGPTPDQMEKLNQIAKMAKQMEDAKKAQHEPVLKTLEKLGISLKTETVAGRTVVMIPLDELMEKEYAYMTGIDMAGVREMATTGRLDIDLADNNRNGSTGDNDRSD
jgi:hypothetical protein